MCADVEVEVEGRSAVVVFHAGTVAETLRRRSWKDMREAVPNQLLGADGAYLLHWCGQNEMSFFWIELPGTSTSAGTVK